MMLSIDPGNNVGWAMWNNGKIYSSGCHKCKNHDDFFCGVLHWLNLQISHDAVIVVESPCNVGKNGNSSLKTAAKCGAIRAICGLNRAEYHEINTQTVAEYIGAKGRREQRKADIIANVCEMFGKEHIKSQDQADAVAIGYAFLEKQKEEKENMPF